MNPSLAMQFQVAISQISDHIQREGTTEEKVAMSLCDGQD